MDTAAGKPVKPTGHRAYGSTPHLPGSRLGPGDRHIHAGQARILTERVRDHRDRVIVTEKLDGSCVAIARLDDDLIPLVRAGYPAVTSPYSMHKLFDAWVRRRRDRFMDTLRHGERVVGEWLIQAHGTRYAISRADDLFVPFAFFEGTRRLPHDDARRRFADMSVRGVAVVSDGPAISAVEALNRLGDGMHGAIDPVEGAVWVCERDGEFSFIAKHVVAEKVDGKYLPQISGADPVWNFSTEELS